MILRRFIKHVTGQNWLAVSLDVVVVVVGVYIGIFIGDQATEKAQVKAAHASLVFLEIDLNDDIRQVEDIIDLQTTSIANVSRLIDVLKVYPVNVEQVVELEQAIADIENPTFTPAMGIYPMMLEQGYLTALLDPKVARAITSIYGNKYIRSTFYGKLLDRNADDVFRNIRHRYFDKTTNTLLATTHTELALYRSGLYTQQIYSGDYIHFINTFLLPSMLETAGIIEEYRKKYIVR